MPARIRPNDAMSTWAFSKSWLAEGQAPVCIISLALKITPADFNFVFSSDGNHRIHFSRPIEIDEQISQRPKLLRLIGLFAVTAPTEFHRLVSPAGCEFHAGNLQCEANIFG